MYDAVIAAWPVILGFLAFGVGGGILVQVLVNRYGKR